MSILTKAYKVGLLLAGSASVLFTQTKQELGIRLFSAAWADTDCSTTTCPATLPPNIFLAPPSAFISPGGLPWSRWRQLADPVTGAAPQDETNRVSPWFWTGKLSRMAAYEILDAPPGLSCLGAYESIVWNRHRVNLPWLRLHLGQVESLQPQRCAIVPEICLTDC